ncbi:hypothetical protein HRI_000872300 [Hibiscus trionum]|uniref:Uncharacterized protein n=1 Tax=Hibiscus trionum TaxID=183268 RepID=A0A9W7H6T6_HIBTR|nr:hypothetical protein HRI_000872300 [Hibiscus trionum]
MAKLKPEYDRASELKAFYETKASVEGLVDAGIKQVTRIFHHPTDELHKNSSVSDDGIRISIPVIDLKGLKEYPRTRRKIVCKLERITFLLYGSHSAQAKGLTGDMYNGRSTYNLGWARTF